eukprot:1104481-Rhodomonas_salina.3
MSRPKSQIHESAGFAGEKVPGASSDEEEEEVVLPPEEKYSGNVDDFLEKGFFDALDGEDEEEEGGDEDEDDEDEDEGEDEDTEEQHKSDLER